MRQKATESPLSLTGDWTVSGVAEQFPRLSEQLVLLLAPPTNPAEQTSSGSRPKIDLGGISDLDACGCQLLIEFSHALQKFDVWPVFTNLPAQFLATIHRLGFDQELATYFDRRGNES